MIRFNLQFFASKKGVSSTKNGRDSESIVKEELKFIQETMLVLVKMILYSV